MEEKAYIPSGTSTEFQPYSLDTLAYLDSEISHDIRCEHEIGKGAERIRWNNRGMGRALASIFSLQDENRRFREALERAQKALTGPPATISLLDRALALEHVKSALSPVVPGGEK